MRLINYTKDKFISVINTLGKQEQVDPWEIVDIPDVDAALCLQNYGHIFKRVEEASKSNTILQNEITKFEAMNIHLTNLVEQLTTENLKLKARLWELTEEEIGEDLKGIIELQELHELHEAYSLTVEWKSVPNNKKNDKERLKAKIEAFTA